MSKEFEHTKLQKKGTIMKRELKHYGQGWAQSQDDSVRVMGSKPSYHIYEYDIMSHSYVHAYVINASSATAAYKEYIKTRRN